MQSTKYPLNCKMGTTFRKKWYLLDQNNDPLNLDGFTGRMQVRADFTSDVLITLTTENGRMNIGDNYIELYIFDEDTSALTAGSYKYDLEIAGTGTTPDVYCPFYGSFKVTDEITRT